MEINPTIILDNAQPLGILGLVICVFSLVRMMNGKLKGKVSRGACHDAQKSIRDKIDTLDKHMSDRFDDMKDFIKENGNK